MARKINEEERSDEPVESNGSGILTELYAKIDSLIGKAKQEFCRTLNADQKKGYLAYLREKDMTMVKGVFKCFEPVGGFLKMSCAPWPGVEKTYEFFHGEEYEVPAFVAKHLETGCYYPTHSYLLDDRGQPVPHVGKKNFRFSFNTGTYRSTNEYVTLR
jgi:hypothetical protein